MAVVGPWAAYGAFRLTRRAGLLPAVFVAMMVADLATYCMTSVQLALAFPDASTGILGAMVKFLSVFAITQLPLAVIEGLVGVVVFRVLLSVAKPELTKLGVLGGKRKESADV